MKYKIEQWFKNEIPYYYVFVKCFGFWMLTRTESTLYDAEQAIKRNSVSQGSTFFYDKNGELRTKT